MKPTRFTFCHTLVLALVVLLLASRAVRAQINPDPGSGQVTAFSITRSVPGATSYDSPLLMAGGEAYAISPDRTGRISLTLNIVHDFQGLVTTSIRDGDGARITSAAGNQPTLTFEPLKFGYPFLITVESPTGDPVFTRLIVQENTGNTLGPGFTGGQTNNDANIESDDEYRISQQDDSGNYDTEGKNVSSGACGSCHSSSCDLTHGNETANADATGPNGRFLAGFSAGISMQGDSFTGVDVEINPIAGVSRSSFKAHGTGDATITRSGGNLATITTGSSHTKFENITGGVQVSISKTPNDSSFRTITYTNSAANQITRTSTFNNKSIQTVWSYTAAPDPTWTIVMGNGARKAVLILETNGSSQRIQRRKLYERAYGATGEANILVADVRETFTKNLLGWRKTKSEVLGDATGPLTTIWEYYGPADGLVRAGLLKSIFSPDGNTEIHDYYINGSYTYHTITRPFASGGNLLETRYKHPSGAESYFDQRVGRYSLSRRRDIWSTTTMIRGHHDGAAYLDTTYTITPFGSDFGGIPTLVQNPDGTRITQSHNRTGGFRNLTVEQGSPAGNGVGEGVTSNSARDQNGILQTKSVTAKGGIGNGATLDSFAVTGSDTVGRPTQIQYFGAGPNGWTISRVYACCGLLSSTDKFGLTTYYHHDDLGRRIRVNRQGLTHSTVYDGLTVRSHRYTETVTGGVWTGAPAPTNEISNTARNLAGTFRHSWERSPQTEADSPEGAPPSYDPSSTLFSTTESQYRNPAGTNPNPYNLPTGIGLRTIRQYVQTADDPQRPTETSDYHLDGRLLKSTGDMSPHIRHTYSNTSTGLVTTVSFLDGTTDRETTTTQYDRAGRVKSVTKAAATTNYFYGTQNESTGKLVKVTDADNLSTLYAYNAKGERVTSAIDVNNNGTIDYGGTDHITITESVPNTHAGYPVWSTITQVHATLNDPATTLVHTRHVSTNGLREWSVPNDGTPPSFTETLLQGDGDWITTTTHPDGTKTKQIHTGGHLTRVEQLSADASPFLVSFAEYGYDILNRLQITTDSRTGPTITAYVSTTCDFVKSVEDAGQRVTSFTHDHRGRRKTIDAPNTFDPAGPPGNTNHANITVTTHEPDGSVKSVSGDQTYPVSYTYDYAGRMKSMTTYRSDTQPVITAWNYSTTSGLLLSKRYDSNPQEPPAPVLPTNTPAASASGNASGPGPSTRRIPKAPRSPRPTATPPASSPASATTTPHPPWNSSTTASAASHPSNATATTTPNTPIARIPSASPSKNSTAIPTNATSTGTTIIPRAGPSRSTSPPPAGPPNTPPATATTPPDASTKSGITPHSMPPAKSPPGIPPSLTATPTPRPRRVRFASGPPPAKTSSRTSCPTPSPRTPGADRQPSPPTAPTRAPARLCVPSKTGWTAASFRDTLTR
jgi:hypothetical protein